jgi:quercetin dioxygenase-like cupin family protein
MCTLTLAVGIAVGVIGAQVLNAQYSQAQAPIPGVKSSVLLKADLVGIEGQEASVRIVELAPGAVVGKHYHPGEELDYVLSGSGTLEIEGKPPLALEPGVTFYVPPKQVHDLKAGDTGLKNLAILVAPKGQPIRVDVK